MTSYHKKRLYWLQPSPKVLNRLIVGPTISFHRLRFNVVCTKIHMLSLYFGLTCRHKLRYYLKFNDFYRSRDNKVGVSGFCFVVESWESRLGLDFSDKCDLVVAIKSFVYIYIYILFLFTRNFSKLVATDHRTRWCLVQLQEKSSIWDNFYAAKGTSDPIINNMELQVLWVLTQFN